MNSNTLSPRALLLTTLLALAAPFCASAQSEYDEQQQLLAQIQADKRAVVLAAMDLDDAGVAAFTPLYDAYQAERKLLVNRMVEILNDYAANYGSMTDEAAKKLMADWFKLQDDENKLMKDHARKMGKALPPAKVLRFVQVENKLNTLLRLPAVRGVPLSK